MKSYKKKKNKKNSKYKNTEKNTLVGIARRVMRELRLILSRCQ
jgi:hypothetical protein